MRSASMTLESRCARIERRAPGHQAVERALDDGLVLGVDRRQRLVENEDRRVAQQRPRDRKPLALSAREPQAALADQSGVALRQRGDEVVRIGGARRRDDLRRRRIGLAEPQIVLDRAVEQISVLPHHGDLRAPRPGSSDLRSTPPMRTLPDCGS